MWATSVFSSVHWVRMQYWVISWVPGLQDVSGMPHSLKLWSQRTLVYLVRGSITDRLTCLTGFDLAEPVNLFLNINKAAESKSVKQEVNITYNDTSPYTKPLHTTGPTQSPRVRTCVYVGVLLHVRLLVESLAAILARIRSSVRVDQEVSGQRWAPLEAFATLVALK